MKKNQFRRFFRVTEDRIYLNNASTGVIPVNASSKMKKVIDDYSNKGYPGINYVEDILDNCRKRIARLIGAEPERITFTTNTSDGLYISLINIPFNTGDEVLIMKEAFPASKYIAKYNLEEIKVRYANFHLKDPLEVVKTNLTPETKCVVIDLVQYFTGERLPVRELAEFLREKGIFLVVDGIQAVGAVNMNVVKEGIDILACGGPKWLNGPQGTGFLFISKRIMEKMKKTYTGWLGAEWDNFQDFSELPPPYNDARRFTTGTVNVPGLAGLSESIKLILDYKIESVEEEICRLNRILFHGLKDRGFQIITPEDRMAGIVTARPSVAAPEEVFERLENNGVVISLRNEYLRFSPHFYNTEEEIKKVLSLL